MAEYTDKDELRHPAGDNINWAENYYFNFFDPVNNIAGYFRIGLEKNKNKSNVWCHLMRNGKPLYNRYSQDKPYTESGLEDLLVGGVRFKMIKPKQINQVSFNDRHLSVDLACESFSHYFTQHGGKDAEGLPTVMSKAHLIEFTEIKGEINIGKEKIQVHGYGYRDHSWGIRDWEGVQSWIAPWGTFQRDFAFSCVQVANVNRSKLDYFGVVYDGEKSVDVVEAKTTLSFMEDGLTPKSGVTQIKDELGRVTNMEFDVLLTVSMHYDFNLLQEGYTRFRMGDQVGYGFIEVNTRLS